MEQLLLEMQVVMTKLFGVLSGIITALHLSALAVHFLNILGEKGRPVF